MQDTTKETSDAAPETDVTTGDAGDEALSASLPSTEDAAGETPEEITETVEEENKLGGLNPDDRMTSGESEEDLLDIPAFLRRQAN